MTTVLAKLPQRMASSLWQLADFVRRGGTLLVVGLSELGKPAGDDVDYDDCYKKDADNQIDIILVGDEPAVRGLTHVEIPAGEGYLPFYDPGGPGPEPTEGVRYTAPGPPDLEPIIKPSTTLCGSATRTEALGLNGKCSRCD